MIPVPLAVHSYQHRSRPLAAQRLVNLYAEKAPRDERTQIALIGAPGLVDFAELGNGPIRGTHVDKDGMLFVVSGATVYKVDDNGSETSIGTVAGDGAVKMDDNGDQLAIVAGNKGYIYDGVTLAQIADPDFPGAIDVGFLDGYFIFIRPDTGQYFISGLYDGEAFDALDFATAEADPDDLIALAVYNQVAWLMGTNTIEVIYNSGNADFPFDRLSGGVIERGLAARESPAQIDNSLFWVGRGEEGGFVVYRTDGFRPVRISQHAIESAMDSYGESVADAVGFAYTQEGHSFYVLTFPGRATFVYDATTGLWHERDSRSAQHASLGQWRVRRHAFAYSMHIVGDYENGKLYTLDMTVGTEAGTTMQRLWTTANLHNNQERIVCNRFRYDMGRGEGKTTGQGSDPQVVMRYSDDGGNTWSKERPRSFGKKGQYGKRVEWRQLGEFEERIFEAKVSDDVPVTVFGAWIDVQGEIAFG